MLKNIPDERVWQKIADRISELEKDPEQLGKALTGPLQGYRSLRAVGQRYRVLYRIERDRIFVYVIAIRIRKEGDKADIYQLAKRLLRLGLLG
jgi:mRNA interferase RelE/StbE